MLQVLSVRAEASNGAGDVPVSADTLGSSAGTVRNLAFGSFWVQLPLTVVSACILFFAVQFTRAVSDSALNSFDVERGGECMWRCAVGLWLGTAGMQKAAAHFAPGVLLCVYADTLQNPHSSLRTRTHHQHTVTVNSYVYTSGQHGSMPFSSPHPRSFKPSSHTKPHNLKPPAASQSNPSSSAAC